jgi:hypothetical protein
MVPCAVKLGEIAAVSAVAMATVACGSTTGSSTEESVGESSAALVSLNWAYIQPIAWAIGAPSASPWAPEEISLFGKKADGQLGITSYLNGTWYPTESLGGNIAPPSSVAWGYGRLDIVAFGTGHGGVDGSGRCNVWHKWFDYDLGGWGDWEDVGSFNGYGFDPNSHVVAASWGQGTVKLFALGAPPLANKPSRPDTNQPQQVYLNNFDPIQGWSGWQPVGGEVPPGGGLAAVAPSYARMDVFIQWTDGQVYTRHYDFSWSNWQSLGTPPRGIDIGSLNWNPLSAATDSSGNPVVLVYNWSGDIYRKTYPFTSDTGWTLVDNSKKTRSGSMTANARANGIDVFATDANNQIMRGHL